MTKRFDGLKERPQFQGYFDHDGEVTIALIEQIQWLVDHPQINNIPEWQRREVFGYTSTHVNTERSVINERVNIRKPEFAARNDVVFEGDSYAAYTGWYRDSKSDRMAPP